MTRVALVGDSTLASATARVNHAWLRGLTAAGYGVARELEDGAGILIHHDYRQHFATCEVPNADVRIAVRTWDFGPFPPSWAKRIGRDFDWLWVHTRWIREQAIAGGVDPDRVAIVPHGVDPEVFAPNGSRSKDDALFTFLFVGAMVPRKGVDILLRAYAEAFGPDERVRLLLKGHSGDVFYQGQHLTDEIAAFKRDPLKPRLDYVDRYLTDDDLAALYRGADAGVFPYRAEGFAMPILEAMACGLPCIVPRLGACLDYCTELTSFFVEPRRIRLPIGRDLAFNSLGFRERVDRVDFCEVPVDRLAAAMRAVYDADREERGRRGLAAALAVRTRWTWAAAVARVVELVRTSDTTLRTARS